MKLTFFRPSGSGLRISSAAPIASILSLVLVLVGLRALTDRFGGKGGGRPDLAQGGGLTAAALTPKDIEDIRTAAKINADYLAVSFPKSGADMYMARQLMHAAGGSPFLIAKIERAEAVGREAFEDILSACDGIMVARGDLAVEVGDASVPALQKRMIRLAGRPGGEAINVLIMTMRSLFDPWAYREVTRV